jgi:hypothetical protein
MGKAVNKDREQIIENIINKGGRWREYREQREEKALTLFSDHCSLFSVNCSLFTDNGV